MKNLTFAVLMLLLAGSTFAQKGVKIGLQFTPGVSMSLQNEDFDRGEDLNLQPAFGYNFGLTVGYGFNDRFSLSTGIMFNNHQSAYIHDRATFSGGGTDPNYKKKFTKNLGYVRIPLLIEIGSDPEAAGGFFFRFGPHFDFMTGGKYTDQRLEGYSKYDAATGIDLMGQTAVWTPSSDKSYATKSNQNADIYNKFVFGLSLDIGGQVRLVENLKMHITLHLETSLTSPEGLGASSFANNMYNDVSNNTLSDLVKFGTDGNIFPATYPNYTNSDQSGATRRESPFNVMGGLTIGFVYTIPVE